MSSLPPSSAEARTWPRTRCGAVGALALSDGGGDVAVTMVDASRGGF